VTRLLVPLAALLLLLTAAPAHADVSCAYQRTLLTVVLSGTSPHASLSVASGGAITVGDGGATPVACLGLVPTVTNTNVITVANDPGVTESFVHIQRADRFAPGAESENGGDPEIEIFVSFNDDPLSALAVEIDAAGGSVRFGETGINTNATAAEVNPDVDIAVRGAARVDAYGGPGIDALGAQGGAGTGLPLAQRILLDGGGGPDDLTGGAGPDLLRGDDGNDRVSGMGGDDTLESGVGEDTLDGGPGADRVSYGGNPAGVTVDLSLPGPQLKGDGVGTDVVTRVENVTGSVFADVLRGDSGPNVLAGSLGADILDGRGDVDQLVGGAGADAIDARDGAPDGVRCGTETDTATVDLPGVDAVSDCETVAFATPAAAGAAPLPPAPAAPLDALPPSFRGRVAAVPRRMTFRYALSEPATVTFTIERRRRGRFRRVATFRDAGAAGANECRLPRRGLRPGRYRARVIAVDAAGNTSMPANMRFTIRTRPRRA
jgi:Ca2+-binding RTX toxin-like protein